MENEQLSGISAQIFDYLSSYGINIKDLAMNAVELSESQGANSVAEQLAAQVRRIVKQDGEPN